MAATQRIYKNDSNKKLLCICNNYSGKYAGGMDGFISKIVCIFDMVFLFRNVFNYIFLAKKNIETHAQNWIADEP